MLRRDFVRAVVSASLAPRLLLSQQTPSAAPPPPAPVPWTLGLNPKTPLPQTRTADEIAEADRRFFTPLQLVALTRLCGVLLPPLGNKPGALEAGTPLFLDFLIGSSAAARQIVYTSGLTWLDGHSQAIYKHRFADLDDTQAGAILKPWLRTWMNDHPPTEPHADFINIVRDDVRTATLNSKAWSDARSGELPAEGATALYWAPIEPELYLASTARPGLPPHVRAAPKAANTIPSYPR